MNKKQRRKKFKDRILYGKKKIKQKIKKCVTKTPTIHTYTEINIRVTKYDFDMNEVHSCDCHHSSTKMKPEMLFETRRLQIKRTVSYIKKFDVHILWRTKSSRHWNPSCEHFEMRNSKMIFLSPCGRYYRKTFQNNAE